MDWIGALPCVIGYVSVDFVAGAKDVWPHKIISKRLGDCPPFRVRHLLCVSGDTNRVWAGHEEAPVSLV